MKKTSTIRSEQDFQNLNHPISSTLDFKSKMKINLKTHIMGRSKKKEGKSKKSSPVPLVSAYQAERSEIVLPGVDADVPLNDEARKRDQARRRSMMTFRDNEKSTCSIASFMKMPSMLRGISEHLDNFYIYEFDKDEQYANYDINNEISEQKYDEEKDDFLEEMTVTPECFAAGSAIQVDGGAASDSISNRKQVATSIVTDIPAGDPSYATPERTRSLVRKFISDIWNCGDIDLIPLVCSPQVRFNNSDNGLDNVGHQGFATMVLRIREALQDYHCEIHSMVVEGNKAFCRLRFSGKHSGALMGYPPTGELVSWMGATEFTCVNGMILKVWELGDMKTLEEQLKLQCYKATCLQQD